MTLSHDGYTYENGLDSPVRPARPAEVDLVVHTYPAVRGEHHLVGAIHGRDLTAELLLSGYADLDALRTALNTLTNQAGQLTGTLTQTVAGVAANYPRTTFLGFEVLQEPQRDGSGVHGWWCRLRLLWRQRAG